MEFSDFLTQTPAWCHSAKPDTAVFYSAVRVCRNYNNIVFPDKISGTQLTTVETLTDKALGTLLKTGKVIKVNLEALTDNEVLVLAEKRLLPYLKINERSYIRLYLMTDYPVFLLINYKDHLTFYSYAANAALKKADQNLQKMLNCFDERSFQQNSDYGFLTSDLNFTGSGVKYYLVADLPYLRYTSRMFQVTSSFKHNSLLYTKFFNQGSDLEDLLMIANRDSYSQDRKECQEMMLNLHHELTVQEAERKIFFEKEDEGIVTARVVKMLNRDSFSFKNYLDIYLSMVILADRGFDKRISKSWLRKKLYEYQPGHYALAAGKTGSVSDQGKAIADELKHKFNFLLK